MDLKCSLLEGKESYNSTVLITEMLIEQHELKNIYLRGCINHQGIQKHKTFLRRIIFATLNATAQRHAFSSLG